MECLELQNSKVTMRPRRISPAHNPGTVNVKFIFGNGRELRDKLQDFPSPWKEYFLSSKTLVIGVVENHIVSAYGIRGMLNVGAVYVKEEYQGKGIGRLTFEKAHDIIRRQGTHFYIGEVPADNEASQSIAIRLGNRLIKSLDVRKTVLFLCPLTPIGALVCFCSRIVCSLLPVRIFAPIVESISQRTIIESRS